MTLTDGGLIPSGSRIPTDVCIVGGGPAGITIALALAGANLEVALLESGGLKEESGPQELANGTNVGLPYYELHET